MSRRVLLGATLAGALIGAPGAAGAQVNAELSAAIEVSPTRLARTTTASRVLAGPIVGAQGRLSTTYFELEGRYGEGSLTPSEGTTGLGEDLVEGTAIAWYTPFPWMAIGAGPTVRAFISPSGTASWVRFDARARLRATLIPGLVTAHVEGWYSASASTNVQGGGAGAQGTEAGLTVRIPRLPVSARLGYVADRASFTSGGSEFVEGIRLSLMMGPF